MSRDAVGRLGADGDFHPVVFDGGDGPAEHYAGDPRPGLRTLCRRRIPPGFQPGGHQPREQCDGCLAAAERAEKGR